MTTPAAFFITSPRIQMYRATSHFQDRPSPCISAAAWRPHAEHPTDHRDLAGVIAVVGDHLPEHSVKRSRHFLVTFVDSLDLPLHFVWRGSCQRCELRQQTCKTLSQPIPILRVGRGPR